MTQQPTQTKEEINDKVRELERVLGDLSALTGKDYSCLTRDELNQIRAQERNDQIGLYLRKAALTEAVAAVTAEGIEATKTLPLEDVILGVASKFHAWLEEGKQ